MTGQGGQAPGTTPFPPFQAKQGAEPAENLIAFFNYLVESHVRLHRHQEAQGMYLRSIYEMLQNAGFTVGAPPSHIPRPQDPNARPALDLGTIADGARFVAQNAESFRAIFGAFFRRGV